MRHVHDGVDGLAFGAAQREVVVPGRAGLEVGSLQATQVVDSPQRWLADEVVAQARGVDVV